MARAFGYGDRIVINFNYAAIFAVDVVKKIARLILVLIARFSFLTF